jgi:acyl-CoA synthetase (AMP-forming)/AMP-acid ligase II
MNCQHKKQKMTVSDSRPLLAEKILFSGAQIGNCTQDKCVEVYNTFCNALEEAGVQPNQVVVLSDLKPTEILLAAAAVWSVDAVPFPISNGNFNTIADFVVSEFEVKSGPRIDYQFTEFDRRGLENTAVLHQTSGSTGSPKIARRSINSIMSEAVGYWDGLDLSPSTAVRVPIPLTHSLGWGVAISSALRGCRLMLDPVRLPSRLSREIDTGEFSILALTPSLASVLTQTKPQGTSLLSAALIGAGAVSDKFLRIFSERFGVVPTLGYGSTETGGTLIGSMGIGKPISGIEIISPAENEQGELVLRMPSPVLGYVGEAPQMSNDWRTGDIVRRAPDGSFLYIERMDGGLRINSRFIDTAPYKAVLAQLPCVDDFVFLSIPTENSPELEEFFVVVESREVSLQQISSAFQSLADNRVACRIAVIENFPRNELGKLDYNKLVRFIRRGRV